MNSSSSLLPSLCLPLHSYVPFSHPSIQLVTLPTLSFPPPSLFANLVQSVSQPLSKSAKQSLSHPRDIMSHTISLALSQSSKDTSSQSVSQPVTHPFRVIASHTVILPTSQPAKSYKSVSQPLSQSATRPASLCTLWHSAGQRGVSCTVWSLASSEIERNSVTEAQEHTWRA